MLEFAVGLGVGCAITYVLLKSRFGGAADSGIKDEVHASFMRVQEALGNQLHRFSEQENEQFNRLTLTVHTLTKDVRGEITGLKEKTSETLDKIRKDNTTQLDKMREVVEEKLHETLEKRLQKSFTQVAERLEMVHKGIGEMQALALDVGDLKRVMTNIKARGTLGEVQLAMILEEVFTISQFEKNFRVSQDSEEVVEFAIKFPGKVDSQIVYLPIDAKFPVEDFHAMQQAYDDNDQKAFQKAQKKFEQRIKGEAEKIASKYILPPLTTDFAILFLPFESLYAEALRIPGLFDEIQRKHRVILASPTTLLALLHSFSMGFKTLAIEQRSHELWKIITHLREDFGTFTEYIGKTQKKLSEASRELEQVSTKSRVLEKTLNDAYLLDEETKAIQ